MRACADVSVPECLWVWKFECVRVCGFVRVYAPACEWTWWSPHFVAGFGFPEDFSAIVLLNFGLSYAGCLPQAAGHLPVEVHKVQLKIASEEIHKTNWLQAHILKTVNSQSLHCQRDQWKPKPGCQRARCYITLYPTAKVVHIGVNAGGIRHRTAVAERDDAHHFSSAN